MKTQHDVFLDEIKANPADDTVRLIYADFLQDEGQEQRAELIRLQCRIAAMESVNPDWDAMARMPGILNTMPNEWVFPNFRVRDNAEVHLSWERGFVSAVEVPLTWWLSYSRQLLRWHPVQEACIRPTFDSNHHLIGEHSLHGMWNRQRRRDGMRANEALTKCRELGAIPDTIGILFYLYPGIKFRLGYRYEPQRIGREETYRLGRDRRRGPMPIRTVSAEVE